MRHLKQLQIILIFSLFYSGCAQLNEPAVESASSFRIIKIQKSFDATMTQLLAHFSSKPIKIKDLENGKIETVFERVQEQPQIYRRYRVQVFQDYLAEKENTIVVVDIRDIVAIDSKKSFDPVREWREDIGFGVQTENDVSTPDGFKHIKVNESHYSMLAEALTNI
tara:strand:+ start:6251 stop:6748 length:498 start_codon:yes stop_codon:yes gene_type:complete